MSNRRGWADVRRDCHRNNQIFPTLESRPEVSRGEQRLAAEMALAQLRGQEVPGAAWSRAFLILEALATA